jgi:DNA-binding GntR family transcriptional regulator
MHKRIDKDSYPTSTEIYERLKEMIVSNELLPKQRIVETEISKRLNVSRTPLREALRRLEAEGYITSYRNRGAIVVYLRPEDIEERFICFANMLSFATSLSVKSITKRQIDELVKYNAEMEKSTSISERIQWVAYNQSFHIILISSCPNQYLLSQLAREGERLWRYWARAFNMVFDLDEYHNEHNQIISAVIDGDSERVYQILYRHISRFSEKIRLIASNSVF